MATININNNYGEVQVADHMVILPGGRTMPEDEYQELWQMEEWEHQARRAQLEHSQAKKAAEDHKLDELISMMQLLAQSIEALREEVHHA